MNKKILIGLFLFGFVAATGIYLSTDDLTGALRFPRTSVPELPVSPDIFKDETSINGYVSIVTTPVTSAVPSVVTSRVTSSSGTSTVASALVSPITSPISSIVPIRDPRILRVIDPREVRYRLVTSSLIEEIEALHF